MNHPKYLLVNKRDKTHCLWDFYVLENTISSCHLEEGYDRYIPFAPPNSPASLQLGSTLAMWLVLISVVLAEIMCHFWAEAVKNGRVHARFPVFPLSLPQQSLKSQFETYQSESLRYYMKQNPRWTHMGLDIEHEKKTSLLWYATENFGSVCYHSATRAMLTNTKVHFLSSL